jgi:predicted phosphoadenosine phosphosulfate sulfurtransferase
MMAAERRIADVFATFPVIYASFSGGKDSSVMVHLLAKEARKTGRRFGLLFVDLEAQYKLTIDHVREVYREYADVIDPYWVSLPLRLRNAVSQYEPRWTCWELGKESVWVRQPDPISITQVPEDWDWFVPGMEFEEFVPLFGHWYAGGQLCACFVGIRTAESLNRWRSLTRRDKTTFEGRSWTTWVGKTLYNVYPIYDWQTQDIWVANGKFGWSYNRLYDRMHQAGLTLHQQRICQPYGDDQRKGLWLYHLIEPDTWGRIVARVNGANSGALYAKEHGNINGVLKVSKPDGHTWESFAKMLLESMPPRTKEHFENKIAVFISWWRYRGREMEDDGPKDNHPNWKRVCKSLLRNDYWCKGLSFTQTKSEAYEKYLELMRKRRERWGL